MLEKLISEKESESLEFKESLSEWKEIIETVSAFSNTKGGIILIGVRNDGEIIGADIGKNSLEDLANKIKENTDPIVFPGISIQRINNKNIIIIAIEENETKPILAFGRVFKRIGRTNQKLSTLEIRKMFLSSSKVYWDELVCRNAVKDDIDEKKVKQFLEKAKFERRLNVDLSVDAKEALKKLNLMKNNRLTNAAILLFGKEPQRFFPQSELRCARFKGTKPLEFIDMKILDGDLINQREDALKFVKEYIGLHAEIKGTERVERWEYPIEAIREAITNAICHRDYEVAGNVQVRIFDDRLEVLGCGPLPEPLIIEDLKKEHNSVLRNPLIAECFFRIGFIEQWGTGTNRMVELCIQHNLPEPIFEESGGSLIVIFRKYYITDEILNSLNERQRKSVEYLKKNKNISRQKYASLFGCSARTAYNDLQEMVSKNILQRKGKGKQTYYELL